MQSWQILLFKNLYGQELITQTDDSKELLGDFLSEWVIIKTGLHDLAQRHSLLGTTRREINFGGGGMHCLTQQQPSVIKQWTSANK